MRNTQNEKYQFVEVDLPVIWFQVPLKNDKITAYGGQPQESIISIANGRYIRHVDSPKRVPNPNPSHTTRGMTSTLSSKHHFCVSLTPLVQCALLFAIVPLTELCFTHINLVVLP